MGRLLFGLLIVTSAVAQAALFPGMTLEIHPNVVLVLLLVWTAQRGVGEGVIWLFGVGLLLDLLAMDPLGSNGLALMVAVMLAVPARRRLFHSGLVLPILMVIAATLLHGLVLTGLRGFGGVSLGLSEASLRITLIQALFNALLVPPLYLIVNWLQGLVPQSRMM